MDNNKYKIVIILYNVNSRNTFISQRMKEI